MIDNKVNPFVKNNCIFDSLHYITNKQETIAYKNSKP